MGTLRDCIDHPDRRTDNEAWDAEARAFDQERGNIIEQRVPRWIARKNESGLEPKDLTGRVAL